MKRVGVRVMICAVFLGLVALTLESMPAPPLPALAVRDGLPLGAVKTWGYQLQGARPEFMAPELDLLVIDHARDASADDLLTPADVSAFRTRAPAPPRIVLAYMSIGEAETYRPYWRKSWVAGAFSRLLRPGWLGRENKEWRNNYSVRYWHPGWQRLIVRPTGSRLDALGDRLMGAPTAYLDQILEAGFDGVYLDRVDAFGAWEKTHKSAEADMATFVAAISAYAKARRPGFLVVAQNGEELLARANFLGAVDGIAKEDLVYGLDGSERANPTEEVDHAATTLMRARSALKPVFVVEYVADPTQQLGVQTRIAPLGFVPAFAVRALNAPPSVPLTLPPASVAPPSTTLPQTSPPPGATTKPQR